MALVAPWDALKAFAYKAKLTPGSQKKGKAAKQALEIVTRAPPAADVMRETREAKKKKNARGGRNRRRRRVFSRFFSPDR